MSRPHFADAALIEASLAAVVTDLTPLVYARLFAAEPAMLALFAHDRSDAVKGEMLARAFETLLDFIGDRNYADHLLRSERVAHDSYGVPPALFLSFYATIAATLRDADPGWSPATAAAWASLLAELETVIA